MERVHVFIRLALVVAMGAAGCSSVYWLLYLALPAVAALLVAQKGPARYLSEDAPVIARALRWLAGAYAYLWLLTDTFPGNEGDTRAELTIDIGGSPTTVTALLRLFSSVPAVLLLALLSLVAGLLWPVGAIAILVQRRLPAGIADFLALTLGYQFRLGAYHLSIVDVYPSLNVPATRLPRPDAV